MQLIIRDRDTWRHAWQAIYDNRFPSSPLPELDFTREMAILVAIGSRPNSGYQVTIDHAYRQDGRLEVAVVKHTAGQSCPTLAVITQPVDVVRLPRVEGPVSFEETEIVTDCKDPDL